MIHHPITTPASPSLESPLFDASCDSVESLTTSFTAFAVPTLETTTVTEVALGYHRNQQYAVTKIFCLSSISGYDGFLEEDWKDAAFYPSHMALAERVEFGDNWCRTWGGPKTREKLDWFDRTDSDDGTIERKQTLDFCCCGENEFFKTTSSPSP
jgi:hypothetical protein